MSGKNIDPALLRAGDVLFYGFSESDPLKSSSHIFKGIKHVAILSESNSDNDTNGSKSLLIKEAPQTPRVLQKFQDHRPYVVLRNIELSQEISRAAGEIHSKPYDYTADQYNDRESCAEYVYRILKTVGIDQSEMTEIPDIVIQTSIVKKNIISLVNSDLETYEKALNRTDIPFSQKIEIHQALESTIFQRIHFFEISSSWKNFMSLPELLKNRSILLPINLYNSLRQQGFKVVGSYNPTYDH